MRACAIGLCVALGGCALGDGAGRDGDVEEHTTGTVSASGQGAGAAGGDVGAGAGPGGASDSGGADGGGGAATGSGGASVAPPLPPGKWTLKWSDDFDGAALDETKWTTQSDSYSDQCRGNHPDHKLEYNLPQNLAVSGGVLSITAKREAHVAPSGISYTWTSGLITTGHGCGDDPPNGGVVVPGDYLQTRARLPGDLGMWPALWTWSDEVDVFEYHPDNPTLLEVTNHTGEGDGFYYDSGIDLSLEWHYFGALVGADQVVWYLDGQPFFTSPKGFQTDAAAIIVNLSVVDGVYHPVPRVDESVLEVDSVEVYSALP
jgi:beta-glucanase (GH16 family)